MIADGHPTRHPAHRGCPFHYVKMRINLSLRAIAKISSVLTYPRGERLSQGLTGVAEMSRLCASAGDGIADHGRTPVEVAEPCGSKSFLSRISLSKRALSRATPDIHRVSASPTTSSVELGAGTPLVDVKATPASCCRDQLLTTARFIGRVYKLMCMRTARAAPPGKVEAALVGSPHALGSSVTSLRAASCGSNGGSNAFHRLTTPAQQALHRDQPDPSGSRPGAEPLR